jgi:hypothetical protein
MVEPSCGHHYTRTEDIHPRWENIMEWHQTMDTPAREVKIAYFLDNQVGWDQIKFITAWGAEAY